MKARLDSRNSDYTVWLTSKEIESLQSGIELHGIVTVTKNGIETVDTISVSFKSEKEMRQLKKSLRSAGSYFNEAPHVMVFREAQAHTVLYRKEEMGNVMEKLTSEDMLMPCQENRYDSIMMSKIFLRLDETIE